MERLERLKVADSAALNWLNTVLWPDEGAHLRARTTSDERKVPGHAPGQQAREAHAGGLWWASPTAAEPHTLIPTSPSSSARRSVRRYHDGQTVSQRVRSLAAEAVLWARPSPSFGPFSELVELVGDPDTGVLGELRVSLGRPTLTCAITLGAPKSNRKPILQLLDQGECVGFAKVATNDWTEDLLENEASWLRRAAGGRPPLAVPELLSAGMLCSRFVLVQASVLPPRLPRRRHVKPPATALFDAIADLDTASRTGVGSGEWWAGVDGLLGHASPRERDAVDSARSGLGLPIRLGAWHGDLTPWNLFSTRASVGVIDWEFAASGVPVGFDVCHFHLQTANELMGAAAQEALAWSYQASLPLLGELGIPTNQRDAVWRFYLVELLRRQLKLRAAGVDAEITHGPAAVDWLLTEPDSRLHDGTRHE